MALIDTQSFVKKGKGDFWTSMSCGIQFRKVNLTLNHLARHPPGTPFYLDNRNREEVINIILKQWKLNDRRLAEETACYQDLLFTTSLLAR